MRAWTQGGPCEPQYLHLENWEEQRGRHGYHRSYGEQVRLWLHTVLVLAAHAVSNCYRKKERAPILASFWDCLPGDEPLPPPQEQASVKPAGGL